MSNKTLLLVDDDPTVLLVLGQILRHFGYAVHTTETGEAAVALCAEAAIDLAILDYAMPGLSGLAVAEILRERFRVPFIFLTAHRNEALLEAAIAQGAHGYLVKPVQPDAVVPAVEAALRRAADARDLSRANDETADIKIAIGVLMGRDGISQLDAERRLRELCRPQGRRMAEVARELLASLEVRPARRQPIDEATPR